MDNDFKDINNILYLLDEDVSRLDECYRRLV